MPIALLTFVLSAAQAAEVATPTVAVVEAPDAAGTPDVVDAPDDGDGADDDAKPVKKRLEEIIKLGDEEGGIQVHIDGGQDEKIDEKVLSRLTPDQLSQYLIARERRIAEASNDPPMVATLVPLFFFLCMAFLVGYPVYLRFRKHGQVQETLRLMVEKGAPIPDSLLEPPTPPRNDTRRGIILVTLGVGLAVCLLLVDSSGSAWGIGLIPLFVGVGYIVAGRVERRDNGGAQA